MIVAYIDAFRHRFGVEPICRVLSEHDMASPEHLLRPPAKPVTQADWDDAHMAKCCSGAVAGQPQLYGADKLATAMRKAAHDVGRDQVARLMGTIGIEGVDGESTPPAPPDATPPPPAIEI